MSETPLQLLLHPECEDSAVIRAIGLADIEAVGLASDPATATLSAVLLLLIRPIPFPLLIYLLHVSVNLPTLTNPAFPFWQQVVKGTDFCISCWNILLLSSSLLSSLELSDTPIYEPSIRALLGTAPHFGAGVVLKLRTPRETGNQGHRLLHLVLEHPPLARALGEPSCVRPRPLAQAYPPGIPLPLWGYSSV